MRNNNNNNNNNYVRPQDLNLFFKFPKCTRKNFLATYWQFWARAPKRDRQTCCYIQTFNYLYWNWLINDQFCETVSKLWSVSIYCYQAPNNVNYRLNFSTAIKMLLFARACSRIITSLLCSSELRKIVARMPFNTSLDTCAGWRQVEAAVVLGRQVTVVELMASVNMNSSQYGILTQIQIQGGDGKKFL